MHGYNSLGEEECQPKFVNILNGATEEKCETSWPRVSFLGGKGVSLLQCTKLCFHLNKELFKPLLFLTFTWILKVNWNKVIVRQRTGVKYILFKYLKLKLYFNPYGLGCYIACENICAIGLPCEIFLQFESYPLDQNITTEIKKYTYILSMKDKIFFM